MPVTFSSLSFRYGRGSRVFDGFSFGFPRGSTVLLGPNGAGKTTLLKLAAGVLRPRSGRVDLAGASSKGRRDRARYRRAVAFMPQVIRPIPGLTCREQVAYVGWLKGMSRQDAWNEAVRALDSVALADRFEHGVSQLSGGQLRRLGVAQAIVHDAEVVLMDEPTAGLDPVQRGRFRELLDGVRGRSDVVVSTHQTEDIVESYDHVAVLVEGHLLYCDRVEAFLSLGETGSSGLARAETAYASVLARNGRDAV